MHQHDAPAAGAAGGPAPSHETVAQVAAQLRERHREEDAQGDVGDRAAVGAPKAIAPNFHFAEFCGGGRERKTFAQMGCVCVVLNCPNTWQTPDLMSRNCSPSSYPHP